MAKENNGDLGFTAELFKAADKLRGNLEPSEYKHVAFDGSLTELAETSETIIAETYPGDVYHWIGMRRRAVWSKRRQSDRAGAGPILLDWIAARPVIDAQAVNSDIPTGFDSGPAGEDQFDAMVGLRGMIAVVEVERGEGVPSQSLDILKWEGWILGHQR